MRVDPREYQRLPLEAHTLLADVPLRDATAIDLPGGGQGRTMLDLRAVLEDAPPTQASPVVRALFGLRSLLGRLCRWDEEGGASGVAAWPGSWSYFPRLADSVKRRSLVPPGTADGPFRFLYVLPGEALSEIRNATVHAFLCSALVPGAAGDGYRLYWGVYVKRVSWLTPLYMAVIEPFRRFLVYPAIVRRIRRAWQQRYGVARRAAAP